MYVCMHVCIYASNLIWCGVMTVALPECVCMNAGAGKTTLLDVISGRKTGGAITGEVYFNGSLSTGADADSFRKLTGYVEQNDIHDPYTTVREGLLFAARMVSPRLQCVHVHSLSLCAHVCMYVCMYVSMYVCMYVSMYVCM